MSQDSVLVVLASLLASVMVPLESVPVVLAPGLAPEQGRRRCQCQ